ncbi:hypothetical protein AX774_g3765 [Zancudomyces culisetae]|uniref:Uncharacterized protein n=1 Tax=Zancudomyces culisetae TaxID=1213189 RepID=A0A1R1PP61_ZANCU|nr:hypothetical protein AX774_g3765 [Zancudomyces culisetae]|eukprot:OMH82744.1 hypothetical protein AX774_g3765 [Zancudomyces culisetae]
MSGLMSKLRAVWIQQAKDEGQYSSDSDRSEATSMLVASERSHDPFKELAEQAFLQMRNPTTGKYQMALARHY